jgi:predicted RecB family nuclease
MPALFPLVRRKMQRIAELLATEGPPDLALNRHCPECQFQNHCREKASEKDDLSLLGGLSVKEREKLRSKGIFSVTQLSYTFRPGADRSGCDIRRRDTVTPSRRWRSERRKSTS